MLSKATIRQLPARRLSGCHLRLSSLLGVLDFARQCPVVFEILQNLKKIYRFRQPPAPPAPHPPPRPLDSRLHPSHFGVALGEVVKYILRCQQASPRLPFFSVFVELLCIQALLNYIWNSIKINYGWIIRGSILPYNMQDLPLGILMVSPSKHFRIMLPFYRPQIVILASRIGYVTL